jgi:stearoyl-CoA desaturase (delta-9 desaturase)
LWSHRSYNASRPLQLFLIAGGSSAVQGSCYWWARTHRSHHRYTDTDQDPYDSKRGLLWTHIGWMIFKSNLRSGPADASDLQKDSLIQFQHRHYFLLAVIFGIICPAIIPGVFWGDWSGGIYFSATLRLTIAHHVSSPSTSLSVFLLTRQCFFFFDPTLCSAEYLLYKFGSSLAWIITL